MQQLIRQHGSGLVTLPKDDLARDGLLDEDGNPVENQSMMVDRLGERCYLVRAVDGDAPELEDCEVIQRLAAHQMLLQDSLGQQSAD